MRAFDELDGCIDFTLLLETVQCAVGNEGVRGQQKHPGSKLSLWPTSEIEIL